jgi:hypothetical protein
VPVKLPVPHDQGKKLKKPDVPAGKESLASLMKAKDEKKRKKI